MAETKIIKLQPGESVTIVCEEVQPTPQPTPEPQPEPKPQDLGKYQYSVGLLSDLHITFGHSHVGVKRNIPGFLGSHNACKTVQHTTG